MDPTKLRHFLAVLETCHFGRAAKATGVSQQAVSKSIARLEEMLDVQLFHRVPQGATPVRHQPLWDRSV